MGIEKSYNFKRVSSCITTSGVVGIERLEGLGAAGYEVLINLLPNESEYAAENEREIVEAQNVEYVYIPVDFGNPTTDDYDQFVEAMDAAKDQNVHIHCAANYRVSAFFALYAESQGSWTPAQANEFVLGLWNPEESKGWPELMAGVRARRVGA